MGQRSARISPANTTEISVSGSTFTDVDIMIDKFNNVFVADSGNHIIQKFDGSGKFLANYSYYQHLFQKKLEIFLFENSYHY
jgi:hypothetical protein